MDKKQIAALVEDIVEQVAADNDLSAVEARTFVGVALRTNKAAFISTVVIPRLGIVEAPEAAAAAA